MYTTTVSIFNLSLFLVQEGMTASDVASLNEHSDVFEVLQLPHTDIGNDIYEVSTL